MFDRYNETARRVLFYARSEVSTAGSRSIAPVHLLAGLVREGSSQPAGMLAAAGLSNEVLRRTIQRSNSDRSPVPLPQEVPFEEGAKRALALAVAEADALGQRAIGPEHLLLGVLRAGDPLTSDILDERGIRLTDVRHMAAGTDASTSHPWLAPADAFALSEIRERLQRAENDGDVDAIIALMADDVVVMVPNEPVQEGRNACASLVRRMIHEQRAWFQRRIGYSSAEVAVHRDVAFDRGQFSFEVVGREDGRRSGATGKYFWLYHREPGGRWLIARAIMSLDDPPEHE